MNVSLSGVSKAFGHVRAVDAVDLEIRPGEFFVLLGPSGCGKTTILRLIAGLTSPTAGSIAIGGQDVTFEEPQDRDVAMAFQDSGLYPHLDVKGNVGFPLKIRKRGKDEIQTRVQEIATRVKVGDLLDRRPAKMSGGERQRVSLARALVREPKVLLMDEPLSNLDAKLRGAMRSEIRSLVARVGVTTVYVTHDQVEAMAMADRIAVMNEGRLEQVASPLEIYDRPATRFVAEFIGSPPMNLVRARYSDSGGLEVGTAWLRELLPTTWSHAHRGEPGRRCLVGFRPEHVVFDGSPGGNGVALQVSRVELLGKESVVVLSTEGGDVTAVSRRRDFTVGETVSVYLDPGHVHIIDETS